MVEYSTSGLPSSILFLRHARTTWNTSGLTMGQSDIALSDIGKGEAEQVVAVLQRHPIDIIVTSPLSRCLATISPFRATGNHQLIVEPNLSERSWGVHEGQPNLKRRQETNPEGGETDKEFHHRVRMALDALPKEKNILVVSHSGVFREICRCGYVSDIPFSKVPHATPIRLLRKDECTVKERHGWAKQHFPRHSGQG